MNQLYKFREDISNVFKKGINILVLSRALKSISLDLKLLAVNGIVQAGKIGSAQGQSLITLSGFLSDLPIQIAPELEDLESVSADLARQLTVTTISIVRFLFYSNSLSSLLDDILIANKSSFRATDFDLLNIQELNKLSKNKLLERTAEEEKKNIDLIAKVNISITYKSMDMLNKSLDLLSKAEQKILNLKRNGFIANYMGSNILIESSYLSTDQQSFIALVTNIRNIVERLNVNLDEMNNDIKSAQNYLRYIIMSISN